MSISKPVRNTLIVFFLVLAAVALAGVLTLLSMNRTVSPDLPSASLDELVASWAELDSIPGSLLHIEEEGEFFIPGLQVPVPGEAVTPWIQVIFSIPPASESFLRQ